MKQSFGRAPLRAARGAGAGGWSPPKEARTHGLVSNNDESDELESFLLH
jgi:hypothetical protein